MQLPEINLDTIADPAARQLIQQLLNAVESLHADLLALRAENQLLRDELARLTGGSGTPNVPASRPAAPTDHSSEAQRRSPTPRGKPKKNTSLIVTREQRCVLDPANLPPDARRHGSTTTLVQDLRLEVEVIRFVREVWLVPSTGQILTAPLPDGYHGAFGPHIQALALSLGYDAQVSQPALLRFFQDAHIQIGAGTLARWLTDHQARWQAEAHDIHQAGLASGSWQASDQTATRVDGHNHTCHVLGNRFFTVYQTRPGGTRQDVLAVLWGQEPCFLLNQDALNWLAASRFSPALLARIPTVLPWEQELSAEALSERLAAAGISLSREQHRLLWDGLAIAAYHAQRRVPVIQHLLSDDAAVYHLITDEHALCWVHDWRHYAKLRPVVPLHQQQLADFGNEYWAFYRELLANRAAPSQSERKRLRERFGELFSRRTGYTALDERIAKTCYNQELLLLVLEQPDIPLHNNDMELAARRRVRKRDVSFGPQSPVGARAWDTFQTIIATAGKLGVRVYDYFCARLLAPQITPSLADRIRERTPAVSSPLPA